MRCWPQEIPALTQRMDMDYWLDIEQRFRQLAPELNQHRIDAQWGAAGEHWRVTGARSSPATEQFEILSSLAGRLLLAVLKGDTKEEKAIISTEDEKLRWYKALKMMSSSFENNDCVEQLNADGSSAGLIFSGTVNQIAEASANLCLTFHASHPVASDSVSSKIPKENQVTQINNFHGSITGQINVAGDSIYSPKLNLTIDDILAKIESSNASNEEKESAKSMLGQFLAYPVVAAIVGGIASSIVG